MISRARQLGSRRILLYLYAANALLIIICALTFTNMATGHLDRHRAERLTLSFHFRSLLHCGRIESQLASMEHLVRRGTADGEPGAIQGETAILLQSITQGIARELEGLGQLQDEQDLEQLAGPLARLDEPAGRLAAVAASTPVDAAELLAAADDLGRGVGNVVQLHAMAQQGLSDPASHWGLHMAARSLTIITVISAICILVLLALVAGEIRTRVDKEQLLQESEQRYRTLVEYAPEAIVVLDTTTGRFVEVNENAERLFGRSRDQLLAMGPADLSPPGQPDGRSSAEQASRFAEEALAGEVPVFEWMHRNAEGADIPCEIRLVRLPPDGSPLIRGSITDISGRKRAERRQHLMMHELDHRVKNTLATVLALCDQTAAGTRNQEEFRTAFQGRIHALARTHEALAAGRWEGARLRRILRLIVLPYNGETVERVRIDGEDVLLSPRVALPLCMALHELATNAAKHGALSTPVGGVSVRWAVDAERRLRLRWEERDGPPASSPGPNTGVGTRLIVGVTEHELKGRVDLDFRPAGLICTLEFPLDEP